MLSLLKYFSSITIKSEKRRDCMQDRTLKRIFILGRNRTDTLGVVSTKACCFTFYWCIFSRLSV